MQRLRLVASVAAAPLLIFAHGALAETTITTEVTTAVQTATADDDLRITSTGKVKPTVAGAAVTLNSTDDDVTNEGEISTVDVSGSIGVQAIGGNTGSVINKATINLGESAAAADPDSDGDADGPYATGTGRYGVQVVGPGVLTGSITNDTTGVITIEGNDSAGISIEAGMVGSVINRGTISVTGNATTGGAGLYGIHVAGPVDGMVFVGGAVSTLGEGAVAVGVDDDITGALVIQGGVSSRGYRFSSRLTADVIAKLDADDLLQGGGAVVVGADVDGGIFLDIRPADLDEDEDDEDNDGTVDTSEGNAAITAFGSKPAMLIGSDTRDVAIGLVAPTGDNAYGLVIKGSISSDGLVDGITSTALQIGGAGGFAADIANGVSIAGSVRANAYDANSVGMRLTDGASVPTLTVGVGGSLVGISSATSGTTAQEAAALSTGLSIEAGASLETIRVGVRGQIAAASNGEASSATAISDLSGTVRLIESTGKISAFVIGTDDADDTDDADLDPNNETITGTAIAIDVRAATAGVIVRQDGVDDGDDGADGVDDQDSDDDGVDEADEPAITGNVLFGAFDDTLELKNGRLDGTMSFGAGADTLTLQGGAIAVGELLDSDGALTINLTKGVLAVSNTTPIAATALNVGAEGVLYITVDPDAAIATRFNVATANFATGAKVGIQLTGLLDFATLPTHTYTIVDAGTLTAGTIDESLLGVAPYIYVVGVRADEAADEVYLDLRRRTATEIGLNTSQTAIFDAAYGILVADEDIRNAFLRQATRENFIHLYDQLVPDQGEGIFSALEMASQSIGRVVGTRPDPYDRYGPDSFWLQELNFQVQRDASTTAGSETKGFGFVGGYESMGADGGALGATLAYVNAEEQDDVAQVGEQTNVSVLEAGVYWRRSTGPWLMSLRGAAGYAWFEGDRRFVSPDSATVREAHAEWNGYTFAANASAGYQADFGRMYLRPQLSVDYLYLSEGARDESGSAIAVDVEERTSSHLAGAAELVFGAAFGREVWWRPEIRVGYRSVLAGEIGETRARFATGPAFILAPSTMGEGAAIIGISLKAGTPMSYLALEATAESGDGEQRYDLRLVGRVMF